MTITVDEVKQYLRVDYSEDDSLIEGMIAAAKKQCMDILRTDDEEELEAAANGSWLSSLRSRICMSTVRKPTIMP